MTNLVIPAKLAIVNLKSILTEMRTTYVDKANQEFNPIVFVVTGASYDNHTIFGAWLPAYDINLLEAGISDLLKQCPFSLKANRDDWFIDDWKGFGSINLDLTGFTNLEKIAELAKLIKNTGEVGAIAINYVGSDDIVAIYNFLNNYHGKFSNIEEHIQKIVTSEAKKYRYVLVKDEVYVFKPDINLNHV